MISIKIHKSYRTVVAACDENLLGKKFEEDNRQLEVKENFYKEKSISLQEASKIFQQQKAEDATFNLVGPKTIQAALDAKIISQDSIDKIQNIPFALILL